MVKSRYTPERVQLILQALRQRGGDRDGWEAGGVSEATFYRWQQEHQEFREAVAQAKDDYRRSCPEEIKKQARKCLSDYLFNGSTETWKSTEVIKDAAGNIKLIKQSTKLVKRETPQWVIDRVLGQPITELEAVKNLIDSNWLQEELVEKLTTAMDELQKKAKAAFQGDLDSSKDLDIQN